MIENSKEMLSTWRWGNSTGVSSRPKRRCGNSASVSSRSKRRLMNEHNSGQIWFIMPDSLFWLLRQWCFVKMRCWFWAAFIFINLKKSESKEELGLALIKNPALFNFISPPFQTLNKARQGTGAQSWSHQGHHTPGPGSPCRWASGPSLTSRIFIRTPFIKTAWSGCWVLVFLVPYPTSVSRSGCCWGHPWPCRTSAWSWTNTQSSPSTSKHPPGAQLINGFRDDP